ncbi:MAG TPA: Bcr/CflA family multidrug efflux MFS transporter [Rhizomicrobium sp.]|nr:Bcr/CflA family multidrug efflux MFS transporter [Rhizomicrobium sp.]
MTQAAHPAMGMAAVALLDGRCQIKSMSEASVAVTPLSRWRHRELILILGTLTAFGSVSIDMYLPAMSAIARDLNVAPHVIANTMASFFLGFAVGQAVFGPIADRFGRKPPLYAGIFLYIAASAVCALTHSAGVLVGARFVQALAACAGGVTSRAAVRDLFSPAEMPRIFAAIMLVFGVAPLVAPFVGGYLLVWFGWRAIFWTQVAFAVLALIAVFFRLEESHGGGQRALHPLAIAWDYVLLLKDRRFIGYVLPAALSNGGMFAYLTGSSHVFIDIFHVPPQHFGWFFGFNALGLIGAAQLPARIIGRVDGAKFLFGAQCIQMLAGLALVVTSLLGGGLWPTTALLFVFVALNGAIMPTASALAMRHFARNAGMASALIGTLPFGLGVVAAAILGKLPATNPLPMTSVMAGCTVAAVLSSLLLSPARADALQRA